MTPTHRRALLVGTLAVLAMLIVSGVFAWREIRAIGENSRVPLPVLGTVPEFRLDAHNGRSLAGSELTGKVWLADFIFTRCAGPCPVLSTRMSLIQERLQSLPDVRIVSFSVDPEWDTPEVLKDYAERYNAGEDWLFLTGEKEAVYDVLREGFKVATRAGDASGDQVLHSLRFALVDRKGRVRAYYNGMDPEEEGRIAGDVRVLVGEVY